MAEALVALYLLRPSFFMSTRERERAVPLGTSRRYRGHSVLSLSGRAKRKDGYEEHEKEEEEERTGQLNAPRQPMHANAYLTGL